MTDDKFEKIEMAIAHQDRQIQDLSEMINAQWQQIEFLKRKLELTQSKLSALEGASADAEQESNLSVSEIAARDKPPHY